MAEQDPPPNTVASLLDRIQHAYEVDKEKWGGKSLEAHGRLGLAELREVFSPGGNIAQSTPMGMFGQPTPGDISNGRDHGVHGPPDADHGQDGDTVHGPNPQASADGPAVSPEAIADRYGPAKGQEAPEQPHRGPEEIAVAIPVMPGGFVERELERELNRNGGDPGSLENGRVLPDEEMENDYGRRR